MPIIQSGPFLSDSARLAALRELGLLDTPAERAFDRLTRLTSRMLDVPVALISLVDESRQFFKSCVGLGEPWASRREMPIRYSFCQFALGSSEPLVIGDARKHPLVRNSPAIEENRALAYVGVPLVSAGQVVGTFCVVDTEPREWSEREIDFLREMASTVMTEVELRAEIAERQRAQNVLTAEQEILERIGRGETLLEVLEALTRKVEQQTEAGLCSVLLVNQETRTLHLAAAPHLPPSYAQAVDGLPVGEGVGSCGTAAYRNELVIVSDTRSDPLWRDHRDLAREHGLVASWAYPIQGTDGSVLGTFAIYYRNVREPDPHERHVVERAGYLAAIAIERARRDERIRAAQEGTSEMLMLLQSVLEGITDPIFAKDTGGNYTLANSAFGKLVGRSVDDVLGQSDTNFFPAAVVDTMRAMEHRVMGSGRPETKEEWIRSVDGEDRFFLITKAPRRDAKGDVVGILGIARDITERKEAEATLQESEERFRQLAESIGSVFWLYDLEEQRALYISPGYERIWGQPRETVYENPLAWMDAVHPEDRDEVRPVSLEVLKGEFVREYRVVRPNGEVRAILDRGFPVRNHQGEIIRAAGVAEDITPLVEARRRLSEREAHYRRLVKTSPEGIYALDAAGRFVELNPAGEEMLERTAAEVLGGHFATVVHPEDRPIAEQAFADILAGAQAKVEVELRIVRPSGQHRLFQLAATGIHERDQITGVHGIARDITEERSREHTMRLLMAALESFEQGVSLSTIDLKFLYANAAWARILGVEGRAAREVDIRDLLPDDAAREQLQQMQRALAEEGQWSGRVWRRRASDGAVIPLDLIGGAVEDPGGQRNLFFILHEATEAMERESRLRRVERLASVGTLIGGVAHELNNPLHAIRNFADLMLLDERDPDDREALEIVKREADRAAKIVSDLRQIARSTHEERSQRAAVDLNDAVRHVLKLRRYSLETRNVEIREDLARDLPPVLANRSEVEQVVLNLVINAEQAMAGQTRERRLILRTRRTRHGASVHVVDNGPGIPAERLERIWDPFYTTKDPGEGTGLGLSLVHSIVSEHGGEIEVNSELGKGTAFRVDLPLAPAAAEPDDPQERIGSAPLRSLRILMVDDEEAIRRVTVRFLERMGHQVDTAREGGEALQRMEGTDYDVIISDLRMPGLDGEELLARLREQGLGKEHRLIFVTGDAASGQTPRIASEANVPMLIKPVRLEELARTVEAIARHSHL